MPRITKLAALAFTAAILTACSGSPKPDPIGVGDGYNELKSSPCACTEIPMTYPGAAGPHGQV